MKAILAFGDSNTFGLNPKDKSRFDMKTRWTAILNTMVSHCGFRVIEEGLCGRTTVFSDLKRNDRRGIDVLPMLLESHMPLEYVILMLGTNDCKSAFHATPKMIADGIRQLVTEINLKCSAKILLISPIHLSENVIQVDQDFDSRSVIVSRQLKEEYAAVAEEGNCLFLSASDYAEPSETDFEHMDEAGHASLAKAIFNKLYADFNRPVEL